MKRTLSLILLGLSLVGGAVKAQDPQFTQFYSNQVMLNPAFTGATTLGGPRMALNYRRQWSAIPGFYKTFAAAFDMPLQFGKTSHGVGAVFMADQAGEGNLTKLDATVNYSYQLDLGKKSTIRFGLAGGIQQSSIDFYKLRFSDQISPSQGFILPTAESGWSDSRITPEVSAGVVYYSNRIWAGVTLNHLTQPKQKFVPVGSTGPETRLPMKISAFGGLKLPLNKEETRTFVPAFLIKNQGPFTQIDLGCYFTLDPLVLGLWYRNEDAVMALVGIKKGPFSVGYSYDYTISRLTNRVSSGSHELSLVVELESKRKPKGMKHRVPPCPRF